MNSKRPAVLMGILLVTILGYALLYGLDWQLEQTPTLAKVEPLPGKTEITSLKIEPNVMGMPVAEFDYYYTGVPEGAFFTIDLEQEHPASPTASSTSPRIFRFVVSLKRGQQHVSQLIQPPETAPQITTAVTIVFKARNDTFASKRVEHTIDWPDIGTWYRNQEFAKLSLDELLQRAVDMIDGGHSVQLAEAKSIIEQIIHRDSRYAPAYIELARIAMKANWGPEGLHQAENLLSSALQIDQGSVNAKILLGYVHTHQRQFAKAEALFSEAASADTKNLWLWSNWGELLAMQGDLNGAAKKYREAITRPLAHNAHDRARLDAYRNLLALASKAHDLDAMEVLYKQRAQEFSECGCYTEYAQFLIEQRGDSLAAINLTRKAIASGNDVVKAKRILGIAYYLTWANATGEERTAALNQARVYLPGGPTTIYMLATNERTTLAVRQLIRDGEKIDQFDNEKQTALALALHDRDSATVSRLLKLGARPDVLVGLEGMPAALIPVLYKDIATINVLQKFGVDYSKIRFQDMTAFDFAKAQSDEELLTALKRRDVTT